MAVYTGSVADDPYMQQGQKASINIPKQTPIARLSSAVEHLAKAQSVVSELSASLVGSVPATDEQDNCDYGEGLMADIERASVRINAIAAAIISEASRAQSRL